MPSRDRHTESAQGLMTDFPVTPLDAGAMLRRRGAEWSSPRKPEVLKQKVLIDMEGTSRDIGRTFMVWTCHKPFTKSSRHTFVRLTPSHVHRTKAQETQTLANWWVLLFQTDPEPVILHSMRWRITSAGV